MRRQGHLIFEVTGACDLECLYCYNAWKNPDGLERPGRLGTAETLAMLDEIVAETHVEDVTLTGGEPLLRPDLLEIIDHLGGLGVRVTLISNGRHLDATMARALAARENMGIVELPLLSSEAAVHDELQGVQGAFDRATLAVAEAKLAGLQVVTVFVATKLNLPTWEETLELAFALGVDGVMFNRFNPGGAGGRAIERLQADPDALAAALDVAARWVTTYELPISCSIPMPPCLFDHGRWPELTFGFCAAGTRDAYYTFDAVGDLRPCNHSNLVLGNLRRESFWDLVDSRALGDFVRARPTFCAGCRLEDVCLGGCKAAAEVCRGSPSVCDPFLEAYRHKAVKLT